MGKGNKIGEAYIELNADPTKLKQDMEAAKTVVEQETAQMGEAVEKNVAGKFQDASSKVSGFVGAATALIGVAAVANRIGDAIGRMAVAFSRADSAASEFRSSTRELADGKLADEIDRLNDTVTSGTKNVSDWALRWLEYGGVLKDVSRASRIAILEEERAVRQLQVSQERAAELAKVRLQALKEDAATRRQIYQENEAIEISQLSGIERIAREEEQARREVLERIDRTDNELTQAALRRRLELIGIVAQAERDAIAETTRLEAEAAAARERLAVESAQKQADALASAFGGALDRVAHQQRSTNDKILGSLRELNQKLDQTARFAGHSRRRG